MPVRVRWPDAARFDAHALERVRLRTPAGALVPLGRLARIDDGCAPSEITRENLRLMVPVTARLEGARPRQRGRRGRGAAGELTLPRGYSVEIGGQRLSQQRVVPRARPARSARALALVLLVLVFQFRSFAAPLAILAAHAAGARGRPGGAGRRAASRSTSRRCSARSCWSGWW